MTRIEGRLDIDLYPGTAVEVSSSRPVRACRVMIGKRPEEVLSLLPLLYSVCGVAQARAALLATQRALGIEPRPEQEAARDLMVLVECTREDLLRIFLDWPRLFDLGVADADLRAIAGLNREFAASLFSEGRGFALDSRLAPDERKLARSIDELERYLERNVFGRNPADWLTIGSLDELEGWIGRCDSIAARSLGKMIAAQWCGCARVRCPMLPPLDAAELLRRFDAADADRFIAFPEWRGRCRETTVLCREQQSPLVRGLDRLFGRALITRWVARLVELASTPARLRDLAGQLAADRAENDNIAAAAAGSGLAQVEAARGRLIHRVRIDDGVVGDYQILAPTEWNFHPRGLIREALESLGDRAAHERERLARIVISAIDPCVGYELRIH